MLRIKLLVFVLVCTNVSARTLTLDALKENLKNKNYNIKAGKEDVESSKSKVLNSKAAFYPKFGIEAGKEFLTIDDESSEESRLSIYGELNLFRGYEDHSQLNKSKFQLQHTKMTLKKKVLESELELEKLFYQLLFLKK
jgi:outer membrane protein TolC